jgi:alpha-beta hydrolase superfamily lysophospholipase
MNKGKEKLFTITKLALKDDYEGRVEATLLEKKAGENTNKAILYVHGFVDYFFQYQLAEWANKLGFNFYAIDLRKYGRSILPHQKPNNLKDCREYFEELDRAVGFIRNKQGNNKLVLMGHSTGGLTTSLYAHHRAAKTTIDALILNSPFFDMNMPTAIKAIALPIIAALGKVFPNLPSPDGLKTGYAESIHKDYKGEWDFDLNLKPIAGFDVNLGWINAIYSSQKELQKGLDIPVPVLVMHASKSVAPGNYRPDMHTADAVLDVKDISRYAKVIGKNVEIEVIENGVHDLILSKKKVRDHVYQKMELFLQKMNLSTK